MDIRKKMAGNGGWGRYFGEALNFCLMMSTRFLLVLLLVASCCLGCCVPSAAQRKRPKKTFRVSGYVLDSVSRKPVAGVFVGATNWGNFFGQPQTDSRGYFSLALPTSRLKSNLQLTVQTVLYEGHAAIPSDTAREMTILLHRNKHQLPTDECAGLIDSLRMAPFAAQGYVLPGTRLAFFIENKLPQPAGRIHAIGIDAKKLGMEDGEYWFRIYQGRGPKSESQNVLKSQGRAFFNFHPTDGLQWFDFKSDSVSVSAQGVTVEFEGLAGCDACWPFEALKHYTPTGPLLSPPCTLAEAHNWLYEYRTGWRRLTPAENPVPLYHRGLQVELVKTK